MPVHCGAEAHVLLSWSFIHTSIYLFLYHSNTVLLDVNSQRITSEGETKNESLKMPFYFIFLDPTSALDDGYLRAMIPLKGLLFMKQLNDRRSAVGFIYLFIFFNAGSTFTSSAMLHQQRGCSVVNVTKGVWQLHLRQ